MLVVGFAVGAFQANCYLVAPGEGSECVIVDPGQDAVEPVEAALREHGLTPAGVLATHGHFDHIHSAATIADAHGVPVYIHPADRAQLADPLGGLGPQLAAMFAGQVRLEEPREVVELTDSADAVKIAGLAFRVDHAPGHTPGSVLFGVETDEGGQVVLAGDTLFAGSIGRTDLPGGDMAQMRATLRDKVLTMADDTVVLPGHGAATTIGTERARNPFLVGLA